MNIAKANISVFRHTQLKNCLSDLVLMFTENFYAGNIFNIFVMKNTFQIAWKLYFGKKKDFKKYS